MGSTCETVLGRIVYITRQRGIVQKEKLINTKSCDEGSNQGQKTIGGIMIFVWKLRHLINTW